MTKYLHEITAPPSFLCIPNFVRLLKNCCGSLHLLRVGVPTATQLIHEILLLFSNVEKILHMLAGTPPTILPFRNLSVRNDWLYLLPTSPSTTITTAGASFTLNIWYRFQHMRRVIARPRLCARLCTRLKH